MDHSTIRYMRTPEDLEEALEALERNKVRILKGDIDNDKMMRSLVEGFEQIQKEAKPQGRPIIRKLDGQNIWLTEYADGQFTLSYPVEEDEKN